MKCPNCQHENAMDGKFCTDCGRKLTNSSLRKQGIPTWAIIVLSVCFIATCA
ncbi:zinc ribbon domain-containing protein [Lysinibacillus sp. FSL K6-0232]|uniref:double zinc ribbon domain-containing protein n=1 Tax=unclassified Lysinibacillus TaxID=2636778 RepID=UPI0030F6296F